LRGAGASDAQRLADIGRGAVRDPGAPALTAIRDAADAVNQHRSTPTGVLRLNTSAGAAQRILRPIIFEYLNRYLEMSVDIVAEGKLIDIVREGFDAGFRLAEQVPADI
jgi:DNA-binding transcriptional LysR family regulator